MSMAFSLNRAAFDLFYKKPLRDDRRALAEKCVFLAERLGCVL